MIEGKDASTWALIAGGLAALGGYLRYYVKNRFKKKTAEWWLEAGIDVVVSVFLGMVTFLIAAPFVGDTAAAGLGGFAGHVGTRNIVLWIHRYVTRRSK